ncbi:MAG TPA: hypothetical protein VK680_07085 [Solirubrobacteraceae bacterium]|jgi:hypothetical protein|nr:hypothetical protein [Solirubrobacteraceae bacterium]
MSASETYSTTYTAADVKKVAARFAADLAMVAESTGKLSSAEVRDYISDVTALAVAGYLKRVFLALFDGKGEEVRARSYEVSTDASLWTPDRPGANLWPKLSGGELSVITSRNAAWAALTPEKKVAFNAGLAIKWSPSKVDTRFPKLTGAATRHYASNAYGLERMDFE